MGDRHGFTRADALLCGTGSEHGELDYIANAGQSREGNHLGNNEPE